MNTGSRVKARTSQRMTQGTLIRRDLGKAQGKDMMDRGM